MFKCCAATYRSAKQPVALVHVLSLCVFIYIHLTKPNMQYGVCYGGAGGWCARALPLRRRPYLPFQ